MPVEGKSRVALCLTGGGAKGAYHVGALKAIAELGVPIHAVSGASIGALNGAIVATSNNTSLAYANLSAIWQELANGEAISVSGKSSAYLTMLATMGVAMRTMPVLTAGALALQKVAAFFDVDMPDPHILDDSTLVDMLEKWTSPEALRSGLPMYASVFETEGGLNDIFNVLKAAVRLGNTKNSTYFHLQGLTDQEIREVLMGSAALPLLFRAREIQGSKYTDGGQGDWYGVGGNTPVQPLVDAGYETIIVVHLCDGSMWDRAKYPNTNIIEIRPINTIVRNSAVTDVLGFDHTRIDSWIEQGYEDSLRILKRIFEATHKHNRLKESSRSVESAIKQLTESGAELDEAMKRIC